MITLRASAAAALEVLVHSKLYPRPVAAPPARGTGAAAGQWGARDYRDHLLVI